MATREDLILAHLPQVKVIARSIRKRLPLAASVATDDLISIGTLGLIAAVDSYDAAFHTQLKTYAEYKIRSAILDSLRKLDFLPREERKRARWIEAAVSELEQEHQRTPTEAEIATHLGIEVSEYRAWALAACTATCSLDSPGASEDNNPMLHCLAASEDNGPSVPLERAALRKLLAAALRTLPLRERTILRLYYCDKLTMREIGLLIAFSASRVSQLRAKAILRLRTRMDNEWPQRGAAGSTV